MMQPPGYHSHVAIACGGTGGHLFPGMAIADALVSAGSEVTLMVSPKSVDRQATRTAFGMDVVTLPIRAQGVHGFIHFLSELRASYRVAKRHFSERPPDAVLAMGGFTSATPILAGKRIGAATFVHEANAIPGRANRLLAHVVDEVFVGFHEASARVWHPKVLTTGTPVRLEFEPQDAPACRMALGLDPEHPVLLVIGGSQGAAALNRLMIDSAQLLCGAVSTLQFIHLTGDHDGDHDSVRDAYRRAGARAMVRPFLTEMDLAFGAATLALARAGASTMAELAATLLPSILVPYPSAADDHQRHNAAAYARTGAGVLFNQNEANPAALTGLVERFVTDADLRSRTRAALKSWQTPDAAARIANRIQRSIAVRRAGAASGPFRVAARASIPMSLNHAGRGVA